MVKDFSFDIDPFKIIFHFSFCKDHNFEKIKFKSIDVEQVYELKHAHKTPSSSKENIKKKSFTLKSSIENSLDIIPFKKALSEKKFKSRSSITNIKPSLTRNTDSPDRILKGTSINLPQGKNLDISSNLQAQQYFIEQCQTEKVVAIGAFIPQTSHVEPDKNGHDSKPKLNYAEPDKSKYSESTGDFKPTQNLSQDSKPKSNYSEPDKCKYSESTGDFKPKKNHVEHDKIKNREATGNFKPKPNHIGPDKNGLDYKASIPKSSPINPDKIRDNERPRD
ncbi:hypothetical protein HZS_4127, partial [Henneguya salminicola]